MQEASGRFKQFSLSKNDWFVLPERQSLVVDRVTGSLMLIDWQHEQIVAVCEDLNDDEQFSVVLTLLEQWPSYVPYAQLLDGLGIPLTAQDLADLEFVRLSGRMSRRKSRAQERARERLRPILQTLRDLLHECKSCIRDLGIDIVAVIDHGPLLIQYEARVPQVEQGAG